MDKKTFQNHVRRVIVKLRKKSGFTQESLAGLLGLTRVSLVNIENGNQAVSAYNLYLLASLFGCSVNEFMPDNVDIESEEKVIVITKTKKVTIFLNPDKTKKIHDNPEII